MYFEDGSPNHLLAAIVLTKLDDIGQKPRINLMKIRMQIEKMTMTKFKFNELSSTRLNIHSHTMLPFELNVSNQNQS